MRARRRRTRGTTTTHLPPSGVHFQRLACKEEKCHVLSVRGHVTRKEWEVHSPESTSSRWTRAVSLSPWHASSRAYS